MIRIALFDRELASTSAVRPLVEPGFAVRRRLAYA
jgi:hypothetical protein